MKILKAKDGFYYTNGESYVKTVILPDGADASVWKEIPEAERPAEDFPAE